MFDDFYCEVVEHSDVENLPSVGVNTAITSSASRQMAPKVDKHIFLRKIWKFALSILFRLNESNSNLVSTAITVCRLLSEMFLPCIRLTFTAVFYSWMVFGRE